MLSVLFIITIVVNKLLKKFEKPIKKNVIKQPFSKFNQDINTTIMLVFFGVWMIVVQAPPIYTILFLYLTLFTFYKLYIIKKRNKIITIVNYALINDELV